MFDGWVATYVLICGVGSVRVSSFRGGRCMAQSHGSSSFVMPLEGSGSVARPFCCRAGAWWPTPVFDGWVATYVLICGLGSVGVSSFRGGRRMARSHGSSSFVMPLEGSGSVARSFCRRDDAWRPTLVFDGWVATYNLTREGVVRRTCR